jgi:hypothetical protein
MMSYEAWAALFGSISMLVLAWIKARTGTRRRITDELGGLEEMAKLVEDFREEIEQKDSIKAAHYEAQLAEIRRDIEECQLVLQRDRHENKMQILELEQRFRLLQMTVQTVRPNGPN